MDNLRWILLILGIALVAVVYLLSRFELWERLVDYKKESQRKATSAPPNRLRREPTHFENTDETVVDEDHRFHFGDDEAVVNIPELHDGVDLDQFIAIEDGPGEGQSDGNPNDSHHEDIIPIVNEKVDVDDFQINHTEPNDIAISDKDASNPSMGESSLNVEPLVLVLTIMSNPDQRIMGPALMAALEVEGFKYGDMEIFDYFHEGKTPALYGVVNVVEPGVFDLGAMDGFSTPGITLFCQLPGALSPVDAFETMLNCARSLAEQLQARVCDDKRNTLTKQVITHYRDQISAFERKLMLASKA